jgi:hypothetical protein
MNGILICRTPRPGKWETALSPSARHVGLPPETEVSPCEANILKPMSAIMPVVDHFVNLQVLFCPYECIKSSSFCCRFRRI